jgi:sRNA-binding regulator protein Hfq
MNNKESLVGQTVAIYLNGGWSISGEVIRADADKILIEYNSLIYMVYRDKISAVCLNYKDNHRQPSIEFAGKPAGGGDPKYYDGDDGGLSLPAGLLTEEAQDDIGKNDFSMFFSRPELKSDDSEK